MVQEIIYNVDVIAIKNPSPKPIFSVSSKPVNGSKVNMNVKQIEEIKQIPKDFRNSIKEFLIKKIARATPGSAGKAMSITS